jgi:hypothetical protein
MSSIDDVLRETISKLSFDINIKTEDFTYLKGEFVRIIEYRKNEESYYNNLHVNEVSGGSISNTFSEKTVEAEKDSPIIETVENKKELSSIESPTTVTAKPSFKEILKRDGSHSNIDTSSTNGSSNSVTSTNSSRNSEQQYFVKGIDAVYDERTIELMENNREMVDDNIDEIIAKNKLITNHDEFIKSLLNIGIPMWKIKFFFYMSNKKYDLTASISTEDVNGPEILHAYHPNQLIDFNDKDGRIVENHKYYKWVYVSLYATI